jgi:hypothetical protein
MSGRDEIDGQDVVAPMYREQVIRTKLSEPTFEVVAASVKWFMLEAFEHNRCPWIIPAAMLEWAKWPSAQARVVKWFWNGVSLVVTKLMFRRAALYSRILTSYAAFLGFPGKKKAYAQGSRKTKTSKKAKPATYVVDVNINLLLHKAEDIVDFTLHGANVMPSSRSRGDADKAVEWAAKSLDFNFERNISDDVLITLVGGGLSTSSKANLLKMLTDLIGETVGTSANTTTQEPERTGAAE